MQSSTGHFGKVLFAGLLSLVALDPCARAHAREVDIQATATFRRALSVSGVEQMNFSSIVVAQGAEGTIRLATDGTISYDEGFSGNGEGAAGRLDLSGTLGEDVEIACETDGKLSNGENTLPLLAAEMAVSSGVAFGEGDPCQGLSSAAVTHTLSSGSSSNSLFFGSRIDVSNAMPEGTFSTDQPDGEALTVRVTYK